MLNVASTVASPGPTVTQQVKWWNKVIRTRRAHAELTEDILRGQRRQFGAQLVLQLINQFIDDSVKVQRDVVFGRQLLDCLTGPHVEAVNGTWKSSEAHLLLEAK